MTCCPTGQTCTCYSRPVVRCSVCHRRIGPGKGCVEHPQQRAPLPDLSVHPLPPISGYRNWRLLGAGGFSRVFAAERDHDGAQVAIKLALQREDNRFAREAAALRRLSPPRVPRLFTEGVTGRGYHYLVMERLEGELLADWLAAQPRATPPPEQTLRRFADLAAVVDDTHALGVLHRDIKPENIFLRSSGDIALIDLGLARALDAIQLDSPLGPDLTQTGAMLGTVFYVAPEQALGKADIDRRADLYSLAVILFEMLTGRPPFVGDRAAVQQGHLWKRPPAVTDLVRLPAAIDDVLARGLAKDANARYPSATALAAAAREALAQPLAAAQTAHPPRASRQLAGDKRPVALLAVIGSVPVRRVDDAVVAGGGQVIKALPAGYVVAFAHADSVERGVTAALAATARLRGGQTRFAIHVADVRVRTGGHGTMVFGRALAEIEPWTGTAVGAHMPTVALTERAAKLVPAARACVSQVDGFFEVPDQDSQTGDTLPRAGAPPAPKTASFWSRGDLLAALIDQVHSCVRHRVATLTTLIGERGLGKSEVLGRLLSRAALPGAAETVCLAAPAPDGRRERPLLHDLLRAALSLDHCQPDTAHVRDACRCWLDNDLAELAWPAAARTLDAMTASDFAAASRLASPTAVRQTLARAIGEALRRKATATPLALMIDDAQWADYTSLDALELATLADSEGALWVCVAARPQLLEVRPNWGARAAHGSTHTLAPLDEATCRAAIAELLQPVEYIPDEVLDRLLELTRGVPHDLVSVTQALRASGAIRAREGSQSWFIAADDLLTISTTPLEERLAATALAALPPDLARFGQLCAVMGDDLEVEDLDLIHRWLPADLGFADIDPGAGLARLAERRLVHAVSPSRFAFTNPRLREALEAQLPAELCRRLHQAAFAMLRDAIGPGPPSPALARHAARSGAHQDATDLFAELARDAEQRFRYLEAEQFYTEAMRQLERPPADVLQRALAGRGRVRHSVGRYKDALHDVRGARALAETGRDAGAVVELLLLEATILDWLFRFGESARATERAEQLARGIPDARLQTSCTFALGRTLMRQQRLEEAIAVIGDAAERAGQLGDAHTRVLALTLLSGALVLAERTGEAERRFAELIELCEESGDRLHLGAALANRIGHWISVRDHERGIEDARRCVEVAREIGQFQLENAGQHNLATMLYWRGELDEALGVARLCHDIQVRFLERPGPEDPLLLARILSAQGKHAAAGEMLAWIDEHCGGPDNLAPSQQVLYQMVALAGAPATGRGDWDGVLERSREHSLMDERLEVLLACAEAGQRGEWAASAPRPEDEHPDFKSESPLWAQRFAKVVASQNDP
jgi:eukaryotic-like serine/threonine-protein kinase